MHDVLLALLATAVDWFVARFLRREWWTPAAIAHLSLHDRLPEGAPEWVVDQLHTELKREVLHRRDWTISFYLMVLVLGNLANVLVPRHLGPLKIADSVPLGLMGYLVGRQVVRVMYRSRCPDPRPRLRRRRIRIPLRHKATPPAVGHGGA